MGDRDLNLQVVECGNLEDVGDGDVVHLVDVLQNPSTALHLLPLVARSAISSSGQSVMIILQDGKTVNSELT